MTALQSEPRPEPHPETDADAARTLRRLRIGLVVFVAIGLLTAWRLGVLQVFRDPAHVKQVLVGLGPWGYLAFVAAYATLQPFGVPGTVFVFAAPLIWPWPIAFALSMVGTMAASVVGFSFARFVARDWISRFIPKRFKVYEGALEKRGFVTVFTLRLVFWMPPLLHAFFGVSRVKFWTHFWGSLAGYVLPLLATAYFGQKIFETMRTAPPIAWVGVAAGALAIITTFWLVTRRPRES